MIYRLLVTSVEKDRSKTFKFLETNLKPNFRRNEIVPYIVPHRPDATPFQPQFSHRSILYTRESLSSAPITVKLPWNKSQSHSKQFATRFRCNKNSPLTTSAARGPRVSQAGTPVGPGFPWRSH